MALVLAILKLNHGTLTYTLDDPYITMAVGDQIRHGWYGIRAGEHSSPVSSILMPFLLAPVSGASIYPVFPLLLNSLALFVTIYILHRFASHLRLFPESRLGIVTEAIALYAVALCLNLIAVVFTGMEHSLHIAVTAACIYGLVNELHRFVQRLHITEMMTTHSNSRNARIRASKLPIDHVARSLRRRYCSTF